MTHISKSKLGVVLTAVFATSAPLWAAPAHPGSQQLGSNRALQSATPPNAVHIPPAPANPIPISTLPFQVNLSGYYQLTDDLTAPLGVDGITVLNNDVVIDLNGYAINGGKIGIKCSVRTTIFNGTVFGFSEDGISGGSDATIVRVDCQQNGGDGMSLGPRSIVQECHARFNDGHGIRGADLSVLDSLLQANGKNGIECFGVKLYVSGCTILESGDVGIDAREADPAVGNEVVVERCLVARNRGVGLNLPARGARVSDSTVRNNASLGVVFGALGSIQRCTIIENLAGIIASSGCRVDGCLIDGSTVDGISSLDDAIVTDCTVVNCGGIGINVGESSIVERCVSSDNGIGIRVLGKHARIEGCTVEGSTDSGIVVVALTLVAGNTVSESLRSGIQAIGDGNRIDGNHVAMGGTGIEVLGIENLIVRNSLERNGLQMQIAADNMQGPFLKTKGFIQSDNPWANFDLSFPAGFP